MTKQQTFKRRVRARMSKSGESYTSARRQLLAKSHSLVVEQVETSPPPVVDPKEARRAALLASRRRLLEQRTGTSMKDWFALIDKAGGQTMSHREIWKWLTDGGDLEDGMLREGVTIAYEQHIGRRQSGQSCEGDFPAAVNRVYSGAIDEVFDRWLRHVDGHDRFNNVPLAVQPKVSATEKFRYWRVKLADGTQLSVNAYRQPDGRILLSVKHRPFADRATADAWRAYWRAFLKEAA